MAKVTVEMAKEISVEDGAIVFEFLDGEKVLEWLEATAIELRKGYKPDWTTEWED